jgi:DNA excision repair protein ERCC-3
MADDLASRLREAEAKVSDAEQSLALLSRLVQEKQAELKARIMDYAVASKALAFKPEELEAFLKQPYVLLPKGEAEWYLILPRFIDMQVGWLERQTPTYSIFIVNRQIAWLADVPAFLKEELDLEAPFKVSVQEDILTTDIANIEEIWQRYKTHLVRREGPGQIRIRPGHHFLLLASLIRDGVLPFNPRPIDSSDIRDNVHTKFELLDYQRVAWEAFTRYGNIGVFWPPRGGKTFLGMYALSRLKGRKLIVVPTLTLLEQWQDRIQQWTGLSQAEIDIVTYHAFDKVHARDYTLTIYDECHRLPANQFSRLATIKTKYRMGLSATPWREDGRAEYIFALTGFPIGLDWQSFLKMQLFHKPSIDLYIVRNITEKIGWVASLLADKKRTMIFCDGIDEGKELSRRFNLDFVYSETKRRLEKIHQAIMNNPKHALVISRVGDEGVSLAKLERVIEFDFLFGSRRQEMQRLGRLFHSDYEGEHVILMTAEEYQRYKKRLYAIYEKGFEIKVHA